MRGIEFTVDIGYKDVLNALLTGIHLDNYDFYISQDEIFSDLGLPKISSKADEKLFQNLNQCGSYYVLFINLQGYLKGDAQQVITTYEDFLKSACQFIILVVDGRYFEIYVKDEQLLLQFIRNATVLNGKDIKIKTDYDDGRTHMSVW